MTGAVPEAGLAADIAVERGAFRLDLRLHVGPGAVVALLGPNGAGKTTALRALAGLLRPSSGTIDLDGTRLCGAGVHVSPQARRVGVVFQDYLLFPHLSARDNIAFGPRCTGASKAAARSIADAWLDRMGLSAAAGLKPGRLSGGQAQRVALARALATSPRMLLLDEPLAALDARTRLAVRADLRRHLAGYDGATVLVTHDPLDAMALAGRIVVLESGAVVQEGPPAEIVRHPRTDYVARLAGLNLYRGLADGTGGVALADGGRLVVDGQAGGLPTASGGDPAVPASGRLAGEVFVAFPPSAVAVFTARPEGSPRNVWPVVVAGVEQYADRVRVEFDGVPPVTAEVTTAAAAELDLAPGRQAWVAVKATETHAYPA